MQIPCGAPRYGESHELGKPTLVRVWGNTVVTREIRPYIPFGMADFLFLGGKMNIQILKLLEKNARMTEEDIATVTGLSVAEVKSEIGQMEAAGIIRGYKGVIDWEKVDTATVSAIIELKVTPTAGLGFEDVAECISRYPEVESVSLMSGACDLTVVVKGKTFQEVASFVAKELAVIDSVTSTATQFIMRRYKEFGVELFGSEDDGRGKISL